jgi:orotidine-5'-phosphate decarboxylase
MSGRFRITRSIERHASNEPRDSLVRDFGARLAAVLEDRGPLCLGIDPHPFLLDQWGLPDSALGVRDFSLRAVEAAGDAIGIVKPQVAFFERHGSAGYAALEEVIGVARAAGLLVIADAKRGDIGSTVDAYGEAWLTPDAPLESDAMTLVAYQGVESLAGPLARARENGKGVFVLAATSNPEARATQTAVLVEGGESRSVAAAIVAEVAGHNPADRLGDVGVVIGATVGMGDFGIAHQDLEHTPILAPGFGEQGASLSDIRSLFGVVSGNVIANVGRGLLRMGPDGLADAVTAAALAARGAR